MATHRFEALKQITTRKAKTVEFPSGKASDYFGINVFDKSKMKKYLSKEAYSAVVAAADIGTGIDRKMADQVAAGMKEWAISRGATHYTHWFHPLTDATAEKHDAFFDKNPEGDIFESFDGKLLAQQEPDASSFPSGGIRNTFEARGYTAWDPTSPAFVTGNTLCIPTIFISYTGEALDYKTPLIRALHELDKAAVDVCQYFDKEVTKVIATLGWEQEYFLVDSALYHARPDLSLTKRTLMGHTSAKDQQLEDHYFGSIRPRIAAYMADLEIEAHKLGIPLKTRHNEVAPNQFECAPIFEECNLAVDHNQLLMDVMQKVASRHDLHALLHEKPFAGINGSGKHNNWSMATNTGVNLLSPGKSPKKNLQFLTFMVNIIKAVHDNADLLRASITSAANQHRLGANEAPPSIISVFIGKKLTQMLDEIEVAVTEGKMTPEEKTTLKLNIGKIPEILLDNTDRNRTSTFAFTGNRFEFRAVGSSENCASPMIVLNTVVANQLNEFKTEVDGLIEKGVKKDEAILQILKQYIAATKKIRFEGNGYSKEWEEEAAKRGLTNIKSAVTSFSAYIDKKNIKMFEKNNVFSEREIEARYEVRIETYVKKIQIESRVLGDLAMNHIVPTALRYQNALIENVKGLKELFGEAEFKELVGERIEVIKNISRYVTSIKKEVNEMIEVRKVSNKITNATDMARAYEDKVKPYLDSIRYNIDKLELIVDDEMWPLPKYRELLFN
ncbi:MAG: glutamine synthetase III [Bacteroidales bacterium]